MKRLKLDEYSDFGALIEDEDLMSVTATTQHNTTSELEANEDHFASLSARERNRAKRKARELSKSTQTKKRLIVERTKREAGFESCRMANCGKVTQIYDLLFKHLLE